MTPSFPTPRSSDLTRHIPAEDLTAMAPHRRILSGSAKHHPERQQMFLARMSEASEWKAVPMRDPLRPALGVRVSNSVGQRRVPISRARRHMRDRKSVGEGKSGEERIDLGGGRYIN